MARPGLSGCFQQFGGLPPALGDGGGQHRQDGEPFPGPGVHPGLAAPHVLAPADLLAADRAGSHPGTPAGRIFDSPVGQVKVEGPDRGQAVTVVDPRDADLMRCPVRAADRLGDRAEPLLPRCGGPVRQAEAADAGMMAFQVGPEQPAQHVGQRVQAAVVQHGLAFLQVFHQQVTDGTGRPAGNGR